jgi:hypothetical protein
MQCGFEQRAQERGLQNTYRLKPERSAPNNRGGVGWKEGT